MKKLIIVAHPNFENYSKITKSIINEIQDKAKNTDIHILNSEGKFDISQEQNILQKYDVITFAFPLWWYSFPWTLKKYFDEVLTPGFGFSFKGDINDFKLRGKRFSFIVSVGNIESTYQDGAQNKHTIENYFMLLDGLSHLLSSGWSAGGKPLSKDEYFLKPIISYGGATGSADPIKTAEEYLKTIDNLN